MRTHADKLLYMGLGGILALLVERQLFTAEVTMNIAMVVVVGAGLVSAFAGWRQQRQAQP